jgi:hypothetical protein
MRRATARSAQIGIALALLASVVPVSMASAADEEPTTTPSVRLLSAQAQQAPGPAVPPPFIYGFFRDPLWPGPGQRFIAAECPIGVGLTIIHYCPGRPPMADRITAPPSVWAPEVLNCDPWFQYFPTCRRPIQD